MISEIMKKELDETLIKKCAENHIPGMALVVQRNGKSIYEKYYGYRNVAEKLPVTDDTIFGLASITKSLTSLAVMQLRDAGKLNVEDKVVDWLPMLKLPEEDFTRELEIHHLMSHTSGFPGLPLVHHARSTSILDDPDGEYLFGDVSVDDGNRIRTVDDLIKQIGKKEFKMLGEPGSIFNYSNEGFGILQKIIEEASGESFITYVEKNIFHPLQMEQSCVLTESLAEQEKVTELYAYKKDALESFHSPVWWDVGDIYTNGSLKTSAKDLMRYAEVYRLNGFVNGHKIVSPESIKEMTSSKINLPNGGGYGYGIEIDDFQGINHYGHGGSIKGVSSNFQVISEKGITASILFNIADVPAEKILLDTLKTLLGISETASPTRHYTLSKQELDKFSGRYTSEEGYEASVTVENDALVLCKDEQNMNLVPISTNDFVSDQEDRYHFMEKEDDVFGLCIGKRILVKEK